MNKRNKTIKILLVDDKPANLFALEKMLGKLELDLFKAQSGNEALELTLSHDFALILLDVQMPGMNGYEVAQVLHSAERTRQIPIIFVTAIDRENRFELKGYETGAVDFIFKPLNDQILISKVKVFLALYQAKDELIRKNEQLEASVAAAEDMARVASAANLVKNQLLAGISHETRTPMNGILGFIELLAEEELTEEQRESVILIRSCANDLLRVINDVLDFSRIEVGKLGTDMVNCSLEELLQSVVAATKTKADMKGIEFSIIAQDQDLPNRIHMDPGRVGQCLIHLLNNAIQFTEQGHVLLRICMRQVNNQHFLSFVVKDTGIGMSAEQQQSVFEPFAQASGSAARKCGGNGLGLTITKQLAELLGGALSVTSEPGQGSEFTLTLPVGVEAGQHQRLNVASLMAAPLEDSDALMQTRFKGQVLLVEDVPTNQKLAQRLLEKLGLTVQLAKNGQEAVTAAQAESFDLILMDMQMPIMNGYEATRKIREEEAKTKNQDPNIKGVPIVALTAHALKHDRQKCLDAGCDQYLSKPIDHGQLAQVLCTYTSVVKEALPAERGQLSQTSVVHDKLGPDEDSENLASFRDKLNVLELGKLIDWHKLVKTVGDAEFAYELMEDFFTQTAERLDLLAQAIAAGEQDEIASCSLAIRSSAATIKAEPLSQAALQIKQCAEDGDLESAGSLLTEIKAEFTKLRAAFSPLEAS